MACIVPDVLPRSASAGERRLHRVLQRLPEDCVVYYEPMVGDRCPDFVVICPELGLLVIEVKGWRIDDILAADDHTVQVAEHGRAVRKMHPLRQARDYMFALMDRCRAHPSICPLLQAEGLHENRFLFPFGYFAVLSNIGEARLKSHPGGDLTALFPSHRVMSREVLLELERCRDGRELHEALRPRFLKSWPFPKLNEAQVAALRAIIHPEIILELPLQFDSPPALKAAPTPATNQRVACIAETAPVYGSARDQTRGYDGSLRVLDVRQENHARAIGDGHRILSGVAGSGKTVILLARAKLLARRDPAARILILCYNVTLASFLRGQLQQCSNIDVCHFAGWVAANRERRNPAAPECGQELGERFLAELGRGEAAAARSFDTVLIDEAQDFESSWFRCVLAAMKDPAHGDLLIVGDGNQGVYRRGKISWRALGIQARGRTISGRFDLDVNYRNSREIAVLAQVFASETAADGPADEDTIGAVPLRPGKCPRATGRMPILYQEPSRRAECARALTVVKDLLAGRWAGAVTQECLRPAEIGILYRRLAKEDEPVFGRFLRELQEVAPVQWLTPRANPKARTCVNEPGVKVQTIHSAKGLQYRAVILLWAADVPYLPPQSQQDEAGERRLFYVGLTRAEDFLALTAPVDSPSPFVQAALDSGCLSVQARYATERPDRAPKPAVVSTRRAFLTSQSAAKLVR